ncbi:hypothetical protein GII36_03265 [Candidatus Mycosynbacter amalyticus]|uniref:Uncharacterized protein n=1 Tax=Candidatus Mycosynbacter amalyticus TaxID=2665156 RepID=A0A857MNM7_9BACT|nr:hypothetical protein [Candidatus Mycosynbacter amalyticus]QHN42859.1 hypothetical protein GII36_03265 [Candidatus Mycosynbacter amalyticus]
MGKYTGVTERLMDLVEGSTHVLGDEDVESAFEHCDPLRLVMLLHQMRHAARTCGKVPMNGDPVAQRGAEAKVILSQAGMLKFDVLSIPS